MQQCMSHLSLIQGWSKEYDEINYGVWFIYLLTGSFIVIFIIIIMAGSPLFANGTQIQVQRFMTESSGLHRNNSNSYVQTCCRELKLDKPKSTWLDNFRGYPQRVSHITIYSVEGLQNQGGHGGECQKSFLFSSSPIRQLLK